MNEAFIAALPVLVDRLEAERERITGVVLMSAKKTFFAGGDLDMLVRAEVFEQVLQSRYLGTKRFSMPVVVPRPSRDSTCTGAGRWAKASRRLPPVWRWH